MAGSPVHVPEPQQLGPLLVADKPSGLLCQPGRGPALADSLLTRLRQRWPQAQLVHRLDRDTSGLLLLALDPDLHRALSQLFAERLVSKTYRADVLGVPAQPAGSIHLPLARLSRHPPLYGHDPTGKPAHTDWQLLTAGPGLSRLQLQPQTGRSHQLRAHLAAIGHPILGDPLYGAQAEGKQGTAFPETGLGAQPGLSLEIGLSLEAGASRVPWAPRLRLHATALAFRHPVSGDWLQFHSACPF
ncbi:MAG: RluA family pseudouridine synthase [Cyanobacteria bacterium]|nr:RluA family pseudouridine synthase [Cyanobacteriota bacterium]